VWDRSSGDDRETSSHTYVEKVGDDCPLGYSNTRGPWCYKANREAMPPAGAIQRVGDDCPLGYSKRKDYCVKR
jgi:hypothetical protein